MDSIINTCFETTKDSHTIAYYSHLLPGIIGAFLAILVYVKGRFSIASKIFSIFVITFCAWLAGDLITWTSKSYSLVYTSWSLLDFINTIFYILGAYFFESFVLNADISKRKKLLYTLLILPAAGITVALSSVHYLNHPVCEAVENIWLTYYKFFVEIVCILIILYTGFKEYVRSKLVENRKRILIVGISIIAFFLVFSVTEFIATQTDYYELNLYSLFILPLFLITILYAIINFGAFNLKNIGSQLLIYGFLSLIAVQFLFLNDTSDRLLNAFTLVMAIGFSYILFKNFKRENEQRKHIEELSDKLAEANVHLQDLDKMKTEFLSLASHQLRSPLTAIKGYASMLLEGSYGEVAKDQKTPVDRIFQSSVNLAQIVEDLLDVSKMEQGGMKFEMADVDILGILKGLTNELQVSAKSRNLELVLETKLTEAITVADSVKIRQVFANYVDNALKYTEKGTVKISVVKSDDGKKIVVGVKDSGMGIPPEIMKTLFKKFERGEGGKVNAGGSGLGLYLAKEIVSAHKGRTWAESEGRGKGSTFFVELDAK
jgi:signal transduction histidine kinase